MESIRKLATVICLCLLFAFVVSASAGTVTGKITAPSSGLPISNGTLSFTLTQSAVLVGTSTIVVAPLNCWTDSSGNIVGLPGSLAVAAPSLSGNLASGTLPAGTYFVRLTWFNATGESEASPESNLTLGSAGTLIVAAPTSVPATATRLNVYINPSSGAETLQGFVSVTNGVIAAAIFRILNAGRARWD